MLSPEQSELLNFETLHPGVGDKKTALIYRHFRGSPVRYWASLHQLAHNPEAVAAYPMTCGRLQRLESVAEGRRTRRRLLRRLG